MTVNEAKEKLRDIPVGSVIQLIKKNGNIIEVRLASHEVSGTERKEYGDLVVPALPPAITVRGAARFGNFRIGTDDIIEFARIG